MQSDEPGSITRWIGDLKAGGDVAAQRLWERYFHRLVRLAQAKLRARRPGDAEDEEDAALNAFDSFCRGAALGRFPLLTDRDDLWRLLVVLTIRKAIDQVERLNADRRGGGRIVGEAALLGDGDDETPINRLISDEPTPEMAAVLVEQYQRLRGALGDDVARQVLDLKLEGYSGKEIANRLGCAGKTVTRKLNLIRSTWLNGEG